MVSDINGTVTGIQGVPVSSTAPSDGYVLQYDGTDGYWEANALPSIPSSLPPSGPAGGDLDGYYPNPTVANIQGVPVSNTSPSDGYILSYDATDGYWEPVPQPSSGLRSAYFTSSGTWTCPAGVTNVLVIGCGGGGGGGGGADGASGDNGGGGFGGGGALQQTSYVSVSPGTNYTITIGAGGTGGSYLNPGNDGYSTTLKNETTTLFSCMGAGGGDWGWGTGSGLNCATGLTTDSGLRFYDFTTGSQGAPAAVGGFWYGGAGTNGFSNYIGGFSGGSSNSYRGGGGGGAGPQGNGGDGGSSGSSGSNAAANTGAGGGGAGSTNGPGGNGGSGYLYIIY